MEAKNGSSFNKIAGDAISYTPTNFNQRFEHFYLVLYCHLWPATKACEKTDDSKAA